jgi:hypothetical protein
MAWCLTASAWAPHDSGLSILPSSAVRGGLWGRYFGGGGLKLVGAKWIPFLSGSNFDNSWGLCWDAAMLKGTVDNVGKGRKDRGEGFGPDGEPGPRYRGWRTTVGNRGRRQLTKITFDVAGKKKKNLPIAKIRVGIGSNATLKERGKWVFWMGNLGFF